eukprot:934493-Prymnesium_polylepis.1
MHSIQGTLRCVTAAAWTFPRPPFLAPARRHSHHPRRSVALAYPEMSPPPPMSHSALPRTSSRPVSVA